MTKTPDRPYFYLAGPMTGIPAFNFPLFDRAASSLRGRAYAIVSPAELDDPAERKKALASPDGHALVGDDSWREFLRRDVDIVMAEGCVGVICLPNWEGSKGARLETYVAEAFGKEILRYEPWKLGYLESIDREFSLKIWAASREVV